MDFEVKNRNCRSYHYEFAGFSTFKEVFRQLNDNLAYYRFEPLGSVSNIEIFYDVPSFLLSDGGIIISKEIEDGNACFNIRKLNLLKNLVTRNEQYISCPCEFDDSPKDYAFDMSAQITSYFRSPFSVDLESIVRQTLPLIAADNTFEKYEIICGTGFRANMQFETTTYKDINSNKKIDKIALTITFADAESKEAKEIMQEIERHVKGLVLYDITKFEIARNLLFKATDKVSEDVEIEDEDEDDDDEE